MTLRAEKLKKALIAFLVCVAAMSGLFVVETALADTAYATTYYTYGYSFKYYDVNNSLVTKTSLTYKSATSSTSTAVTVYNASQTRANCTFKGWSTNVAATSGATTISNARNKKTKPTTSNTYGAGTTGHRYYAIWQPNWSLVKSLGVGGAQQSATLSVTTRANPSYALTEDDLADASATGYTFDGWYRDSAYATAASAGQVIYNSATIYAKWIENEYKVKFDGNGANSNVPKTGKRPYTENYTVPDNIPTRLGSTFVCWNTKADGSGTDYMPGATISGLANTENEITLFAKWNMHVDILTTEALTLEAKDTGEIAGSKFYILNQSDFDVRCKELAFVPENGWTCVNTTEDMPKDSKKIGLKCTSQQGHEMKTPLTDVLITDEETKGFRFVGKAALSNKGYTRERVGTMVSTIAPKDAIEEAKTILYSDGTLIINEPVSIHSANMLIHGSVTAEYPAYVKGTTWNSKTTVPWVADTANRESIKHVEFGSKTAPDNMAWWFYNCRGLESLDSTNLDTSNVTDMNNMFWNAGYNAITFNLDLSSWNTSKVTDMSSMFASSGYNATTFDIDLSGLNTSKVTNMEYMFYEAGQAADTFQVDLGGLNTSKVTNMYGMLDCAGDSATTWNIGDISGWDVSNVTDMGYMFHDAGKLPDTFALDLSGWDVSNVTNMSYMFLGCAKVKTIYASSDWNHNGLDSTAMFEECTSLVGGNGTAYSSSNVDATYAHPDAAGNPGYFTYKEATPTGAAGTYLYSDGTLVINELASKHSANVTAHGSVTAEYPAHTSETIWSSSTTVPWVADTANRESIKHVEFGSKVAPQFMSYWFYYCKGLESFDSTNLDTSNVTNVSAMFMGAGYNAATFNLDLSSWDTSNVTDMSYMFNKAGYNASIWKTGDLSSWNTSNVTDMEATFQCAGYNAPTFDLDISGWNTSNVTTMSWMFYSAGHNATTFNIDLSGLDTSSVASMKSMFEEAGYSATTWDIGDIGSWDTSKVTDMSWMFWSAGYTAETFNIGDLSSWNISNVTAINSIFCKAGHNATIWKIGDISGWNVSNVTAMYDMFFEAGYSATSFDIGDLSGWNTSNVTDMSYMFQCAGYNAKAFELDLSGWDVSNVTNMSYMFYNCRKVSAIYASSDWNHSGLTSTDMFSGCNSLVGGKGTAYSSSNVDATYAHPDAEGNPGYFTYKKSDKPESTKEKAAGTYLYSDGTLVINELASKHSANVSAHGSVTAKYSAYTKGTTWNSSSTVPWVKDTTNRDSIKKVEFGSKTAPNNMAYWFNNCRYLESLDSTNLDTSNVTDMSSMFASSGYNATTFDIDLSGLSTSKVTDMEYMFCDAGYNATTFDIGDLSGWDVSNVTSMYEMFYEAGRYATTWDIGDLSGWDVSNVTSMYEMFSDAGESAITWDIGDLSGWNTANVTAMNHMFAGAGESATIFDIGDLGGWDTSNVTKMYAMFYNAGKNATTWNIGDISSWDTSKVTIMSWMFYNAGYSATTYQALDLSGWNVAKVTSHDSFKSVTWITEPTWVQ